MMLKTFLLSALFVLVLGGFLLLPKNLLLIISTGEKKSPKMDIMTIHLTVS